MDKIYKELQIEIINLQSDVIRTSAFSDPFDDGYNDPNLDFGN